ncbi:MAG: hypothetical protein ACXVRJ_01120 [Gaiellaceae bacterium]
MPTQDPRPEVPSAPAKLTFNGRLYQPFESGARAGVTLTEGGVESYSSPNVRDVVFPAASVHEPVTEADASSGPEYDRGDTQETPPEVASLPLNETETAWLYQPLASAPRAGVAVTDGPVESYWNPKAAAELTLPATSTHVPAIEAEPSSGPE